VLYITDDLADSQKDHIHKYMDGDYGLTIVDDDNWKKMNYLLYDIIIMDYGMLGDEENLLRKMKQSGAKLGWCGAMSERYNEDAKRHFPKLRFLHDLPYAPIRDFGWFVDHIVEINKMQLRQEV
jgi:hypothetical protein